MEKTYKPGITDSVMAAQELTKHRFVGFIGRHTNAGDKAFGVCDETTDQDQLAPVVLNGVLLVETGGAITAGDPIASDGRGRAVSLTDGDELNGYALDGSAGTGEFIRIARGLS